MHARFRHHAFARHCHDDDYVVGFIEKGVHEARYNRTIAVAPAGSVVLINPGEPHDGYSRGKEGYTYHSLHIAKQIFAANEEATESWTSAEHSKVGPLPELTKRIVCDEGVSQRVIRFCRLLESADALEIEREGALIQLIDSLARYRLDELRSTSKEQFVDRKFVSRIEEYLRCNLGEQGIMTLARGSPTFSQSLAGRLLIQMGTTSPGYSTRLYADVSSAGGRYVEAPVSGSRVPAERGELVALMAGDAAVIRKADETIGPVCKRSFYCGRIPNGMRMKLANNLLLVSMLISIVQAVDFAKRSDLDLEQFLEILAAGQMASDLLRVKARKAIDGDFSSQASVTNVLKIARLIDRSVRQLGQSYPAFDAALNLCERAQSQGLGDLDIVSVSQSFDNFRQDSLPMPGPRR